MPMEITFEVVAAAAIFITSLIGDITGALTLREKAMAAGKPFKDEHESLLRKVDDLETVNYHQTRAMKAMLKHMIDGDDVEGLKKELSVLDQIVSLEHNSHQIRL